MPLKTCNRCKDDKDVNLFYANKRMKDGLNTFCIACHKADNLARKAKNRANPEFKAAESVYKKQYRECTVAERAVYMAQWRAANREHLSEYGKAYRGANKALYNFLCQRRKIDLMHRTPKWLTSDDMWLMEQVYELARLRQQITGGEWHVDHIVPLRGKNVSGLHVPLNLRVIPRALNQRKANKFEV
jgi:hypothetical protein